MTDSTLCSLSAHRRTCLSCVHMSQKLSHCTTPIRHKKSQTKKCQTPESDILIWPNKVLGTTFVNSKVQVSGRACAVFGAFFASERSLFCERAGVWRLLHPVWRRSCLRACAQCLASRPPSAAWLETRATQEWRNRTPVITNISFAGLLVFLWY